MTRNQPKHTAPSNPSEAMYPDKLPRMSQEKIQDPILTSVPRAYNTRHRKSKSYVTCSNPLSPVLSTAVEPPHDGRSSGSHHLLLIICLLLCFFIFFYGIIRSYCDKPIVDCTPAVPASPTFTVPTDGVSTTKPESDEKSPTKFDNSESGERSETEVDA